MTIELKHKAERPDWALSDERIPVFSVVKRVPNPDFGKPLTEQPERVAEPGEALPPLAVDERETIERVVEYTMPAKPNPGLALQYLKRARVNADLAASWLVELAIGEEGYEALSDELIAQGQDDPDGAQATMQNIIKFVSQRALGGLAGKA